jgi:REP element-mobilizing transposase RayT
MEEIDTQKTAFLTLRIEDGKKIFKSVPVAEWACLTIRAACGKSLVAFVVMPDHVHVLYEAKNIDEAKDISRLLAYTMSSIQEIEGHGVRDALWFPAKTDESKKEILENPIRHGLCKTIEEYPWSSCAPSPLLLFSQRVRAERLREENAP